MKKIDLTQGSVAPSLLRFAFPLMIGNLLQQLYNIVDTLIVGRYVGKTALAAVGSAYTLMIFLTSIIIGLCMGSGTYLSIQYGRKDDASFKQSLYLSKVFISIVVVVINLLSYLCLSPITSFMNVPSEVAPLFIEYLLIIFGGLIAVFIYNYISNVLRAVGNSDIPLVFLAVSVITNIVLDIVFVKVFCWGVSGAAWATIIAQYLSAIGILIYYMKYCSNFKVEKELRKWNPILFQGMANLSLTTCVQQSIMNFGILMVQGLVNRFGTVIMAAFASGVKIDTLAYAPVQDFGNAFSTFIAQNHGARQEKRIQHGIKVSAGLVAIFCIIISTFVYFFAGNLMSIFVPSTQQDVILAGVQYLRIEGVFYIGIGILFLLYGYYRGIQRAEMSIVLTIISLGLRVVLAYLLSSTSLGVIGIWLSIPIGWFIADLVGILYGLYIQYKQNVIFD